MKEENTERRALFFDFRKHRWTGRLGSGNDEWFFMPLRLLVFVYLAYLAVSIYKGSR